MEFMGIRAEAEGGDVEKGGEDVWKGGDDVQKEGVKEVERYLTLLLGKYQVLLLDINHISSSSYCSSYC